MEAIKEGVGALILQGDNFLTIEERQISRRTHKIPGMRSMIFETIEGSETHHDALVRALNEEVNLGGFVTDRLDSTPLCKVQLTQGVWLHAYLLPINVPCDYPLEIGVTKDEVENPGWDSMVGLLKERTHSLRFRPGNREVIRSYMMTLPNFEEQFVYQYTSDVIGVHVYHLFETKQNKLPSLWGAPALS